jgi:hypothetical protein
MTRKPDDARKAYPACAAAALSLLLTASCAPVPRALDRDPESARRAADEALLALALRFGPVQLDARFAALRPLYARAGLVPSRAFDEASAWTSARGNVRELGFQGTPVAGDQYALALAAQPKPPEAPGEYRGLLALTRLRAGEFVWRLDESLALGSARVAGVEAAADALIALAEAAPPGDARPALRAALPRSALALGRLFSLERLQLSSSAQGGRLVLAEALLHPEWLQQLLPGYARFLQRQVMTLRLQLSVADADGVFWEFLLQDGRLQLRARVADGALAPLAGPPRRLPRHFVASSALTMKTGIWSVGFSRLVADVTLARGPRALGLRAQFQREPQWQIPFLVAPFLRGSLRRPFEGEGALLGFGLRDVEAPPALVASRHYRLAVSESWIVRWLGGNVGAAVADFRRGAQVEADRFARDALIALRDDVRALLAAPWPP